jgi:uncharacterized protein (TIGR02284 family)
METTTEKTTEILNDLIAINNDRILGYEKATEELKDEDADLQALFTDMIAESHQCKMELATEVAAAGVNIEEGSTAGGKFYRAWMLRPFFPAITVKRSLRTVKQARMRLKKPTPVHCARPNCRLTSVR